MKMKLHLTRLSILAVCVAAASLASADRNLTTPTSHRYVSNVPESEIDALVADGFRMFDIEVLSTGPYRYAGSFVRNTGVYEKAWWWTADKTGAALNQHVDARNARILDLEVTVVGGVRKYAATMIDNRGDDHMNWWWFDQKTYAEVQQLANERNAKVTDLDVVMVGSSRRYAGIMVSDPEVRLRTSWTFTGLNKTNLQQTLAERGARLIDLERIDENLFAGVMEESTGSLWWWQLGLTWEELQFAVDQFGARVIDIERYVKNNKAYFNCVLLNNSNALETRIGSMLRTNNSGARGFMLKQVGGPVKGSILDDYRFYPASTIKALEHFYWTRRISGFGVGSQTPVPLYSDSGNDVHPANGATIASWSPLQTVMQQAMIPSNNQNANALQDFAGSGLGVAGRSLMNSFAQNVLGLTNDLWLNHKFGINGVASDSPNRATVRQFCKLFEKSVDGSVLSAGGQAFFHDNMLNEGGSSFITGVNSIVGTEGVALGKSLATRNAFRALIRCTSKGGSVPRYVSAAGWIRLPIQTAEGLAFREFTGSCFVDDASTINSSMTGGILPEMLREEIRSALSTWP
jgi:hypothetical protein